LTLGAAVAPTIAAIGLSTVFIKWVTSIYQQTCVENSFFNATTDAPTDYARPEALRCLMGYIVDLTLVMEQLFLDTFSLTPPRLLSADQIDRALEKYKNSEAQEVHHEVREYLNKVTFAAILKSNNAHEKVIELIQQHRASGF
jgi:hypothetical protein